MSCSQSSTVLTQTEAEARFALLLKPIQELTKEQWAVNLSNNLGEYLHFLRDFSVTIEGNYKMNFAQAAMIIQNSTQLYGKRIDHLWDLMREMLDTLHNQRNASNEDGEGVAGDNQSQKFSKNNSHWDNTALIDNIDVPFTKKRSEEIVEDVPKIKFINLVPKDVLKLEDAVASANPLKVKIFNRLGDLLCYSTDLRTNLPLNAVDCLLGTMQTCSNIEPQNFCEAENSDTSVRADDNIEHSFGNHEEINESVNADQFVPAADGTLVNIVERNQQQAAGVPPPLIRVSMTAGGNPWDPLDPYEEVGTKKEAKQGKHYRLPSQLLKTRNSEKDSNQSAIPPVDYHVYKEMLKRMAKSNYCGKKLLPEYRDDAVRRNRSRMSMKRSMRSSKNVQAEESSDSEAESDAEDNRAPSPLLDGEDHLVNDLGDSDNMFDNFQTAQSSDVHRENPFDMLERRMQEYMEAAHELAQSSEMTKRVAQWHDMIKPRLLRAENRRDFDIHEYGSKILEAFGEDAPCGTKISYNVCLQGQEKEEVARLFLATLQLTNAGNVDIIKLNEHELAIHEVELRLKSRERHHEQIEEFNV